MEAWLRYPWSAEARKTSAIWLGLALVLALGAWFRLDGLRWDAAGGREHHLHPDERFLTMVASSLEPPSSAAGYLDTATSPLNPQNRGHRSYVYGTLPLFLVRAVAGALGRSDFDEIHLVGRALAACFGLLTIVALWLLARRLHGQTVAWLAALLLALAVLPIQQAHFFVVDPFANTFVVLGLLFSVEIQRRGATRDFVGFGLALGAAMACKISAYLLAPVAAVAAAAGFLVRRRAAGATDGSGPSPIPDALRLWLSAAVALAAFRLLQPYAFAGPGLFDLGINEAWWRSLQEVRELLTGTRDFPPGHQWADRAPYWFPWRNMVAVGLGPALGLAAWGGWLLAGWRLFRRRDLGHLVPWLWILLVFALQGRQFVTSLRYFLPIYPALALFAAWLVVEVGRRAFARGAPVWRRSLAVALSTLVVLGTLAWAWAFTSIYRRPHSRVEASRWIYENVPRGSTIAVEVWDDPLPLALDGRDPGSEYGRLELDLYAEDTPGKLDRLVKALERTDYVVLSSDRLVESIPRLPMRYPMTTRYYRALLSGDLGFAEAAEATSYPALLGRQIHDDGAEEAFRVYDHPRVRIFVKTPRWSAERARALLGDVDWEGIDRILPRDVRSYRRTRLPESFVREQADGGTWSAARGGLFDPASAANRWPVAAWALALALLGVAAFPVTFAALGGARDGGWMVARTVGLLWAGTIAWLLASFRWLPFTRAGVWCSMSLLGLVSLSAFARRRREILELVRTRWRLLLAEEVVFWAFFALLLAIRWANPDLWHPVRGGEKPMDFAYLNAVVRSTWFPAIDPWFAGAALNYYYFGFVLAAVPVLMTGIVPQVAYNLLVPTFYALTAAGAFAATAMLAGAREAGNGETPATEFRLSRRFLGAGLTGAVLVALVGNLAQLKLVARWLAGAVVPDHAWFWDASRAIPRAAGEPPPITEFPFFGFLYADLHAHLMALPLALLALALAVHLVVKARPEEGSVSTPWIALALLALTGGALWPTNAWDYPAWLVLAGAALALRARHLGSPPGRALARAGGLFLLVVVAGRLLFLPFARSFTSGYTQLEPWRGARTPPFAFLTVHGLFLFVLGTWLLLQWTEKRAERWTEGDGRNGGGPRTDLVLVLIGLGLGLAVAVELVVVRGDVGRMNTVFKSYLQIWWLWGVAAAAVLPDLLARVRGRPGRWAVWGAVLALLTVGAGLYPCLAVPARIRDRFVRGQGPGLSGEAFMREAVYREAQSAYELRWDLSAMRWLRESVDGSPTLLEGALPPYGWGSRFSVHTGLPTVIGWASHERQQRPFRGASRLSTDPVSRRAGHVWTIYATEDLDLARDLIDRYGVRYVIVGELEVLHYPASGLAKFEREGSLFARVYENPGVRIYEVLR